MTKALIWITGVRQLKVLPVVVILEFLLLLLVAGRDRVTQAVIQCPCWGLKECFRAPLPTILVSSILHLTEDPIWGAKAALMAESIHPTILPQGCTVDAQQDRCMGTASLLMHLHLVPALIRDTLTLRTMRCRPTIVPTPTLNIMEDNMRCMLRDLLMDLTIIPTGLSLPSSHLLRHELLLLECRALPDQKAIPPMMMTIETGMIMVPDRDQEVKTMSTTRMNTKTMEVMGRNGFTVLSLLDWKMINIGCLSFRSTFGHISQKLLGRQKKTSQVSKN
jgi:hypothetical protein